MTFHPCVPTRARDERALREYSGVEAAGPLDSSGGFFMRVSGFTMRNLIVNTDFQKHGRFSWFRQERLYGGR